jgi:Mg-chelatase subunit ChlD
MAVSTLDLSPGSLFAGQFRIMRPLAKGGMGAVYVVEQVRTGRERALKLMHPMLVSDAKSIERFEREAQVGSRIDSDHVVEVIAAGVEAAGPTALIRSPSIRITWSVRTTAAFTSIRRPALTATTFAVSADAGIAHNVAKASPAASDALIPIPMRSAPRSGPRRAETAVLVIDCSGSMAEPMEGRTKIAVVEEAILHLIHYKQRLFS